MRLRRCCLVISVMLLAGSCGGGSGEDATPRPGAEDSAVDSGTPCVENTDCADSREGHAIGRCGLQDVWCEPEGVCTASCREPCRTVTPDFAACGEGLICNHSRNKDVRTYCTALPIPCASSNDCPLYLPDANDTWTCDDGVCTFPRFE